MNADAAAVAVAATTRYSTDVALSQRHIASNAMAAATIHAAPRQDGDVILNGEATKNLG